MNMQVKFLDALAVTLTPEIEAAAAKTLNDALKTAETEAKKKRDEWCAERQHRLASAKKLSDYEINSLLQRALDDQELCGDFEIEVQISGEKEVRAHSVAEVLENKDRFHHELVRDPVEPDYDGGRLVGKLFLDGRTPKLVSKARGGKTYKLLSKIEDAKVPQISVEYSPQQNDTFIDTCIAQMRATGSFFRSGMTVVHIRNGRPEPVSEHRLAYELSKIVLPYRERVTKAGKERTSTRFDRSMLGQVMEVAPDQLPELKGFSDHPVVLPDGTILTEPGYDASSGLFILNGARRFPRFHLEPNDEQLEKAVETCLRPFRRYVFDDEFGKSAALFAVMLAVLRPVFACAPMIITTSHKTGVGKGYFQQALAVVRLGEMPELRHVESKNAAEFRKMLFTLLYESKTVIALDNMDGPLRNETLSSFITAPVWSDRILGESKSGGSLRNDALLLLNGCRIDLGKNIARKVLRIGLTEAGDSHRFRDFGFLPHKEAREQRHEIISAALTIACHAKHAARPDGTIGSFEEVNDLIRVPIADIAGRLPQLGLRDPLGLFASTVENDVDSPEEADILELIHEHTDGEEFASNELRLKMAASMTLETAFREFASLAPTLSSHSIGAILNQLRGERFGSYILRSRKLGGKNRWCVVQLGEDA